MILKGRPGAVYYLSVSLASSATNKGGSGNENQEARAEVDARLSKAPILYAASVNGYIAGGTQTTGYSNVGVFLYEGRVHCSGTVVGPRTILTAAHCLWGYDKSKLTFALGSNYHYPTIGPLPVADVAFPSDAGGPYKYNPHTYEDDIGVVHMASPFSGVKPAVLFADSAAWPQILSSLQSLLFVGFGFNVVDGEQAGLGIKREGQWRIDTVQNRSFSFKVPGLNTCYGDSGGPAFVEAKVQGAPALLLAGVTSVGDQACTQGTETRVDAYAAWLKGRIL